MLEAERVTDFVEVAGIAIGAGDGRSEMAAAIVPAVAGLGGVSLSPKRRSASPASGVSISVKLRLAKEEIQPKMLRTSAWATESSGAKPV
jgi:hypothetical protein